MERSDDEILSSLPADQKRAMALIALELQKAIVKHPSWPIDQVYGAAIVSEESGELIRAAIQYKSENGAYFPMLKEAVQTGAMVVRFLVGEGLETMINEKHSF